MGYFGSFFFVLDLASTLTLIFDISVIMYALEIGEDAVEDTVPNRGSDTRAGGRAGSAVKLVRVVRLIRIFRLLKLFVRSSKPEAATRTVHDHKASASKSGDAMLRSIEDDRRIFEKQQERVNVKYESRVGKSLEEATIRIVVVLVLIMIFSSPFLHQYRVAPGTINSSYGRDALNVMTQKENCAAFPSVCVPQPLTPDNTTNHSFAQKIHFEQGLLTFLWATVKHPDRQDQSTQVPESDS